MGSLKRYFSKSTKLIIFCLTLCVSSCGMSNDEIIAEVNKCRDAKLFPQVQANIDGSVRRVVCIPK